MKTRAYASPYANPQSRFKLPSARVAPMEPDAYFSKAIRQFISQALASTLSSRHIFAKRFSALLFKAYPLDASARLSAREQAASLLVESIDWAGAAQAFEPFVPTPAPSPLPTAPVLVTPFSAVSARPTPPAANGSTGAPLLSKNIQIFLKPSKQSPRPWKPSFAEVKKTDAGLAWLLSAERVLNLVYTLVADDPFVVLMTLAMARAKMRDAFNHWSSQRAPRESQEALSFLGARFAQESFSSKEFASIYSVFDVQQYRALPCLDLNVPASSQADFADTGVDLLLTQAVYALLSQRPGPVLPEAFSRLLENFGSDFVAAQALGRGLASIACSETTPFDARPMALRGSLGALIGPGGWLGEDAAPLWLGVGERLLSNTQGRRRGPKKISSLQRVVETLRSACEGSDLSHACLQGLCLTHELSVACLLASDGTGQEAEVARVARLKIDGQTSPPWLLGLRQQADALLCRDDLRESLRPLAPRRRHASL